MIRLQGATYARIGADHTISQFSRGNIMIASTSTLKIQSGKAGEFETLVAAVTAKVRANEPGNVLYQLTKSRADDNTYRFLELYKDQDAFTRHGQTEYYKEMMNKAGSLLAAPPNVETFDTVG
jgi:quinol monooxygenase YgiN